MLQAANTDLFNPLVPKAHNSECQNLLFPLQIKLVKVDFSHSRHYNGLIAKGELKRGIKCDTISHIYIYISETVS